MVSRRDLPLACRRLGITVRPSTVITAPMTVGMNGSVLRTVDRVAIVACLVGLVLVVGSAGTEQPSVTS